MICKKCEISEVRSKKAHYCESCYKLRRKEIRKKYYLENKEIENKSNKEYKEKNKEKIKEYNKKYVCDNYEILSKKRKEKRIDKSEYLNKKSKEWRKLNKEKVKEYNRKHIPLYRKKYPWRQACRNILYNTIKRIGGEKQGKTNDILGYSPVDLKKHIMNMFKEGMSWDNYGEWHIDHIRPVSSFSEDDEISDINSLENLQPLWKLENLKKGKK
jgi:hypothetical protein